MASVQVKALNLAKIQAKLAKLPASANAALKKQLPEEVKGLVDGIKRAMDSQYDTSDHNHQALRESVHSYPNPHRAVSYVVIADAKDADGKFIGSNVEQGHRARDGSHVAGRAAFWPTWRAMKKAMKRRTSGAARKAIRQEWSD